MLNQLPSPPPGRTGWPWTEESEPLPAHQPDGREWLGISIITPSYNQGEFIEETIRSILLQNYPNIEYIIIDGGSTDETIKIIKKYNSLINYWISEPDNGQSHAINKGFLKSKGEYVNWICSDDILCKNALTNIAPLLTSEKEILLLGNGYRIDRNSKLIDAIKSSGISSLNQLVDIGNFWRCGNSILQQSVLFPLTAVKKAGYLNEKNKYAMDYELWGRFMINKVPVVRTEISIGMFRWYQGQKTSYQNDVTRSLTKSALYLVFMNPETGKSSKLIQKVNIWKYRIYYKYRQFRSFLGVKRRYRTMYHG